ncbi:ThiF family adenylyltransferase [Flavobacterium branchiarum]|uniref:ThiF family adenylyltransferase n=1 Tax=Flavobacterium branchiarum TaxID=1114870 RepID=A0ABV5FIQ4_9FLAO|nr:ThiF family adenylyltransferase [Flavobacterium branchiarum]MDN3675105.1 ThiF family adenylyltransferase [Flavobacterium branchiarum]
MSNKLINRSTDLKRLRDEGYEIEVRGGHLIVHHIPYINSNREVKIGKLISTLLMSNEVTLKPDNHVINFMGEHPCNNDGSIITSIQHVAVNQQLFNDIILNHSFSNRPPNGYDNYYDKVTRYVELIIAPAKSIDPKVTATTFRVMECSEEESVFRYLDTNSSRANINFINEKFKGQRIGIIGLGGTGSYILDQVAKTPVDEILLFDNDEFLLHNAFRAPGAPTIKILNEQQMKVDYFASIYSNMRRGIIPYAEKITEQNIELLKRLSFVFICIDSNSARGMIISHLKKFQIPFIDVGLGVEIVEDSLAAILRTTLGTPSKHDHIFDRIGTVDTDDNEYSTNIQIADLNAMNALLAVLKWKKLNGFYKDLKEEHHSTYTVNTGQLLNDDYTT